MIKTRNLIRIFTVFVILAITKCSGSTVTELGEERNSNPAVSDAPLVLDGRVDAAATIIEPIAIISTSTNVASPTQVMDFALVDIGADGLVMNINTIEILVMGTANFNDFRYFLNYGAIPEATLLTSPNRIRFTGLNINVPNGGSLTTSVGVVVKTGITTTDNQNLILSFDESNVVTTAGSSSMNLPDAAVANGTGSIFSVTATELRFTTQPPAISTINSDWSGGVSVSATDLNGVIDADYATNVAMSAFTDNTCTTGAGGTLSSSDAGGLTHSPVTGAAAWTNTQYDAQISPLHIRAISGVLAPACSSAIGIVGGDNNGTVIAAAGVIEPINIASTITNTGTQISVFDFTIADSGGPDTLGIVVNTVRVTTSGTANAADFIYSLFGPDCPAGVTGTYAANVITFSTATCSGANITVASGGNETYTIKAYAALNPATLDNQTLALAINGDTDLTLSAGGSQMSGSNATVLSGAGAYLVTATSLLFAAGPPASAVISSDWTGGLTVSGVDANNNVDLDYTGVVVLAAKTDALCTAAAGGILSSADAGGLTKTASAGSASWVDTKYDTLTAIYVKATEGAKTTCSTALTVNNGTPSGQLVAGAGAEPTAVSALIVTPAAQVQVFDFLLRETPADADTLNFVVNQVRISTTGSVGNPVDVIWELSGPDGTWVGSYAAGTITFNTAITIADNDNTGETYVVKAYFASTPSTTVDNQIFKLSINGDTGVTLGAASSQTSGANVLVDNGGSGFKYDVVKTTYLFGGSLANGNINTDLTGAGTMTITAADSLNHTDFDFTGNVTLSQFTNSTCLSAAAGALASTDAGGLVHAAVAGVAVWDDVKYPIEAAPALSGVYIKASDGATSGCSAEVVVKDNTPPTIIAVTTLDLDNNGKIDHYKITFNKAVKDSNFPGYLGVNALGTVTATWLIAGYTNIRIDTRDAVVTADVDNDNTIYLAFTEAGAVDSGAKPDLTTTVAPGLTDNTAAPVNNLAQIFTGTVTEADGALPLFMTTSATNNTTVSVSFSETVQAATTECAGAGACAAIYTISGGLSVTNAVMSGGAGIDGVTVILTTATQTGGNAYTLTGISTVIKDLANNAVTTPNNTVGFTGGYPITQLLSASATNSTTVVLTFNAAVTAASSQAAGNYSIPGLTVSAASNAGSTATVTLTTSAQTSATANGYTVTATSGAVISTLGAVSCDSPNNAASFTGDVPPTVVSAASINATSVDVTFSEPVQWDAAANGALLSTNYSIAPALAVSAAVAQTPNTVVRLTTAAQTSGTLYTITINNIKDAAGNLLGSPNQATFTGLENIKLVTGTFITGTTNVFKLTFSKNPKASGPTTNRGDNLVNYSFPSGLNTVAFCTSVQNALCPVGSPVSGSDVYFYSTPAPANGVYTVVGATAAGVPAGAAGCIVPATNPNTACVDGLQANPNDRVAVAFNPPTNPGDGPIITDPFNDGATVSGQVWVYNGKLFIGPNNTDSGIIQMDINLANPVTINLDADNGTAGNQAFRAPLVEHTGVTLGGIDNFYAGCYRTPASVISTLTGAACTGAGGTEYLFVVGYITSTGSYQSQWNSTSTVSPFIFSHITAPAFNTSSYRAMSNIIFKGYTYQATQHQGTSMVRWSRMIPSGVGGLDLNGEYLTRLGCTGTINNGNCNKVSTDLASIDTMYEYDNDGAGANQSQLYIASGGSCIGACLTTATGSRATGVTDSDGGILRSVARVNGAGLEFSTQASPPVACTDAANCNTMWQDVTPTSSKWYNYMSISLPIDAVGDGVCGTIGLGQTEDWDCLVPKNTITPAIKAIPAMVTFNGDLYMIRNACSSITVQTLTAAVKKTCPAGNEVPQLWRLPAGTTVSPSGAAQWVLVAENGASGKTNMAGLNASGANNKEVTMLIVNGNRLFIGFDNATNGLNLWRTKAGVTIAATESNFEPICAVGQACVDPTKQFGFGTPASYTRIFSSVTVNDAGTDYVIFTSGNGANVVRVFRAVNN